MNRTYMAIDLKSFYASVECVERELDPLYTNLVVADPARTEKTICLAVSPSLKSMGVSSRPRLFEALQKLDKINEGLKINIPNKSFIGSSWDIRYLTTHPNFQADFIIAPPRMKKYIYVSSAIYNVYLKWIAPEDIHVYSIDEVFIDATDYLNLYKMNAKELCENIIKDALKETGITATAGIGTNLYLAKIAMDIVAKKMSPDEHGVRIATLNEKEYREKLWNHKPITDFWRIGAGYQKRLEKLGIYTMGDIARCSIGRESDYYNEELLYKTFGINAEILIDHAWGYEPCTIKDIKNYIPKNRSFQSGQVLKKPYDFSKARLVIMEMADELAFKLVRENLTSDKITLTIGYDSENFKDEEISKSYTGNIKSDYYGREIPEHSHGTYNFNRFTSSSSMFMRGAAELFEKIADPKLLIRRMYISADNLNYYDIADLFNLYDEKNEERERKLQKTVLKIREKYGKNAIIRGMDLEEDATSIERNLEIGGHRA